MKLRPRKIKIQAIGIVRDSEGKIKLKDPEKIPTRLWDQLDQKDKEDILNGNYARQ